MLDAGKRFVEAGATIMNYAALWAMGRRAKPDEPDRRRRRHVSPSSARHDRRHRLPSRWRSCPPLPEQIRRLSRVIGVAVGQHVRGDLTGGGIHDEVQLAPLPACSAVLLGIESMQSCGGFG